MNSGVGVRQAWSSVPRGRSCCVCHRICTAPRSSHERVSYAWAGLSRASHQHAYELSPTSSELVAWIEVVEQLVAHVQSETAPGSGSTAKPLRSSPKRGERR